jgi:hypothetical protein
MKKATRQVRERDTMRAEYDFTNGVRGRYAPRFREGVNVVVLDPDVAQAYGTSEAVNRALRAILEVAPTRTRRRRTA